jgi:hypothetical protein
MAGRILRHAVFLRRPVKKPSKKQEAFVEAKMLGMNDHAAALSVGADDSIAGTVAVREQLVAARRWLTDVSQIKRLDVIEGIIDGIEMARHLGDPGSVIKGWVEVGKLLGYANVETKITNLTINQMQIRSKFESMPLEDLVAVMEGRQPELRLVNPGNNNNEEAGNG